MYNNTFLINRKFRPQGLLLVYILCVRFFFLFLNVFDSFCWALNTHNKLTKSNKIKLVFWIFTNWKNIVLSSRKQIAQCITASWIFVIFVPCEYDMENFVRPVSYAIEIWDWSAFFLRKSAPMSPQVRNIMNLDLLNLYRFYKSIHHWKITF